jgi:dihydrofolate synthase/folylpolyglutamate synthase
LTTERCEPLEMTPKEALHYIDSLDKFGIRLGLERIRDCLSSLGNPQNRYPTVHVAGTNGKGSTCALTAEVLRVSGKRVGLYTSPPLERFGERIRIDGEELAEADLPALLESVLAASAGESGLEAMTQFEVITAIAFEAFARKKVDVAVIEVGLGGRLDSTNVIVPAACAITNVALEHAAQLGPTPAAIAREKAGIIKPGVPVATAAEGEALEEILRAAAENKAPVKVFGRDFTARRTTDGTYVYEGSRWRLTGLGLGLSGSYQTGNLAVALALLESLAEAGWDLPEEAVRRGVAQARWAGRLELSGTGPRALLDGAHNPHAALALADALRTGFPRKRLHLILGILGDKDAASIVGHLAPLADRIFLTRSSSRRALTPEELGRAAGEAGLDARVLPDLETAWSAALDGADREDIILITGSLTLVGEARSLLRRKGWIR